jgi:hypothetical protein
VALSFENCKGTLESLVFDVLNNNNKLIPCFKRYQDRSSFSPAVTPILDIINLKLTFDGRHILSGINRHSWRRSLIRNNYWEERILALIHVKRVVQRTHVNKYICKFVFELLTRSVLTWLAATIRQISNQFLSRCTPVRLMYNSLKVYIDTLLVQDQDKVSRLNLDIQMCSAC